MQKNRLSIPSPSLEKLLAEVISVKKLTLADLFTGVVCILFLLLFLSFQRNVCVLCSPFTHTEKNTLKYYIQRCMKERPVLLESVYY